MIYTLYIYTIGNILYYDDHPETTYNTKLYKYYTNDTTYKHENHPFETPQQVFQFVELPTNPTT